MKNIPEWSALPVAAAFLLEISFYLAAGSAAARNWLAGFGKVRAALLLTLSAVVPWLVYAFATGEAGLLHFVWLLLIVLVVSFWYVVLPAIPAADALFLTALAAIYLSKAFDAIYPTPIPKQAIATLGHLMVIRTAAVSILVMRGHVKAEFRFLPNRREWLTGMRYFAAALPVVAFVYWSLGLVAFRPHPLNVWQAAGTFLAILWVVALSEEFFFRGLLQDWLEKWTGNRTGALIAIAVIFGSAHLGFHRVFPNWRWAIVAGVLGVFLGLAWRNSRSVQASMVTHALIVTIWKVFLQ
jgi:membrane protease YdiL (CAAX protease family)